MHENLDRLDETFKAHEHLTPNIEEVLEKANLRARTYRRRRRAAQATGASVLGAGIVASGLILPGEHWGSASHVATAGSGGFALPVASGASAVATSLPIASPSPTASTSAIPTSPGSTEDQEMSAYFAAGYDYDNAVALGKLWHETDIAKVKAEAGLKLLQGETLPMPPNGTPETPQEKAQDAFFSAGYDYYDALALGKLWNETDLGQIKTQAGQDLLAGQSLPIAPGSGDTAARASAKANAENLVAEASTAAANEQALSAYFAAGYDYNDALALGKLWNETDLGQIKTQAGQDLLAGQSLPVAPSGSSATSGTPSADPSSAAADAAQQRALAAYFGAGYNYDDAVALGNLWHETDLAQIKTQAGQKLLDGQPLPIAP